MIAFCILWFLGIGDITFTQQEIRKIVEDFIFQQITLDRNNVIVEFRNITSEIQLQTEQQITPSVLLDKNIALRGNVTLPVEFRSNSRVEKRVLVSVKIRTFENTCTPSRQILKGEILKDEDILEQKIETTDNREQFFSDKNECIGLRAKRTLQIGSTISRDMLEALPILLRGQIVTVYVQNGGVTVTVRGEVQKDGSIGEVITVKLERSHERVKVKVLDNESVLLVQ
ncbi:MAG: flagellar basal body P-ring formation chaperone FlgA [Bacteroidota bacterium]